MIDDVIFDRSQQLVMEVPAGATGGVPSDSIAGVKPVLEVESGTAGGSPTGILLSGAGFDFRSETSHTFVT